MKGVIEEGEKHYTYLAKIFSAIKNAQVNYNWLITDIDCFPHTYLTEELLSYEYCWMSGDELTNLIREEDFQWVWAVFTGFEKTIPLEKVLEYELPYAEEYTGFYKNLISIQHPLASVEIAAIDSSFMLLISKEDKIIEDFKTAFPQSEDLTEYNAKREQTTPPCHINLQ